jgi:hypothetical protein
MAAWSDKFHTGLLREFALGETMVRNQGPGLRFETVRCVRCYYPTLDYPAWTAWGVVAEIALRRMLAHWRGEPDTWASDLLHTEPVACEYPAVMFSRPSEATPACLLVRVAALDRTAARPGVRGVYRRSVIWDLLPAHSALEANDRAEAEAVASPTPEQLWEWATMERPSTLPHHWLGDVTWLSQRQTQPPPQSRSAFAGRRTN